MKIILTFIFYILLVYVAVIPFIRPIFRKNTGPKTLKNRLKYFTGWGWSFIAAICAFFALSIYRDYIKKIEIDKQHKIEKAFQSKLDSIKN